MMRTMSLVNGDGYEWSAAAGAPSWRALKERVQSYLELQGVPQPRAERHSHEIVVMCAQEAESWSGERLDQRALSEAQTILAGWRSARRGNSDDVLEAA
jgi:hypothetical protein